MSVGASVASVACVVSTVVCAGTDGASTTPPLLGLLGSYSDTDTEIFFSLLPSPGVKDSSKLPVPSQLTTRETFFSIEKSSSAVFKDSRRL